MEEKEPWVGPPPLGPCLACGSQWVWFEAVPVTDLEDLAAASFEMEPVCLCCGARQFDLLDQMQRDFLLSGITADDDPEDDV